MEETIVLTPEGFQKLQEELEDLKEHGREEIRERMKAVEKVDAMSDDPEYEDIKKDQGLLESRITNLENVLQHCKVLSPSEIETDKVGIGSKVNVQNLKTQKDESYKILSSVEASPVDDKISDVCPVGRALMRAKVGDVVTAHTPNGDIKYLIQKISRK